MLQVSCYLMGDRRIVNVEGCTGTDRHVPGDLACKARQLVFNDGFRVTKLNLRPSEANDVPSAVNSHG